jgi:hypothetical protein
VIRVAGGRRSAFAAHEDAVAERDEDGEQFLRRITELVEFDDAAGIAVGGLRLACDSAGPERVVSDEQATAADAGDGLVKHVRVLVLVHITKDEIEFAGRAIEKLERVADLDVDRRSDVSANE